MAEIKFSTINQAKIVFYKSNAFRSVIVNFNIRGGSCYEKGDYWGVFHFLEHLIFNGTKQLPTRQNIENFKHDHGVNFNGSTSRQNLNFWFKFPDIETDAGIFFTEQVIFNPVFPENEFTKEINIITQEFQNKWDNPHNRFYNNLNKNLYGSKNIICRDGIGQPDFIKTATQKDLTNLHQKFFQPQNMTITVVGNFDSSFIKKFKSILKKYPNTFKVPTLSFKTSIPKKKFNYQDTVDQSYLNINWIKNKKYSFEERCVLNLANFIIGSSTNSILYQKLRHHLGLVYDVNSSSFTTNNIQNFEIWSSFDSSKTNQIISTIKYEIDHFLKKPITQENLDKNRRYMDFQTLMYFDSINNISNSLSQYLFHENKIYLPKDIVDICQKITPKQIYNLTNEILNPKNMIISIMTPKT